MTPPARGTIRWCSSVLLPLVIFALFGAEGTAAARLQAARHQNKNVTHDVVPASPEEHPDGVRLVVSKPKPVVHPKAQPKPAPRIAWPAIPQEQLARFSTKSVFSGLGAWVDVYDYPVLPLDKTIRVMRNAGVQTLYVETGGT